MTAQQVLSALRGLAKPEKADFLPGFFQAIPGGYGEGDQFLGCVVPDQRRVAKQFRNLSRAELRRLFASPWHECRLTGMLVLVLQFQKAFKQTNRHREKESAELVDYYLSNLHAVNNWDIVDSTAHKILGAWLIEHPQERVCLDELSKSDVVWERRIAVIATYAFIKNDTFEDLVRIANRLLGDHHELIHKAVGWMLREMGKRDPPSLNRFLEQNATAMPRTMLRYSIERLPKTERESWMQR